MKTCSTLVQLNLSTVFPPNRLSNINLVKHGFIRHHDASNLKVSFNLPKNKSCFTLVQFNFNSVFPPNRLSYIILIKNGFIRHHYASILKVSLNLPQNKTCSALVKLKFLFSRQNVYHILVLLSTFSSRTMMHLS
jgi:hypothetical protein